MKRQKRIKRKGIGVLLVLVVLLSISIPSVFVFAYDLPDKTEPFYKVTLDDPEWQRFQTTAAMRQAIKLDEDSLKNLSTEELLRAVLEYPLMGDIFFFNTPQFGIEKVAEHCTALRLFWSGETQDRFLKTPLPTPKKQLPGSTHQKL